MITHEQATQVSLPRPQIMAPAPATKSTPSTAPTSPTKRSRQNKRDEEREFGEFIALLAHGCGKQTIKRILGITDERFRKHTESCVMTGTPLPPAELREVCPREQLILRTALWAAIGVNDNDMVEITVSENCDSLILRRTSPEQVRNALTAIGPSDSAEPQDGRHSR